METIVEHVDVWAANIEDKPGGLAGVLSALRDVGANLQLIIARRAPLGHPAGAWCLSRRYRVIGKSLPPPRSVSTSPKLCTRFESWVGTDRALLPN